MEGFKNIGKIKNKEETSQLWYKEIRKNRLPPGMEFLIRGGVFLTLFTQGLTIHSVQTSNLKNYKNFHFIKTQPNKMEYVKWKECRKRKDLEWVKIWAKDNREIFITRTRLHLVIKIKTDSIY